MRPEETWSDIARWLESSMRPAVRHSRNWRRMRAATEEDFAAAERQFLEDHEEDIAELRRVAPEEIADDVEVLLAAQEEPRERR